MKQNRLKFAKSYLVGPMDHNREKGRQWRAELSPWLIDTLGVIPYDPYNKPVHKIHSECMEDDDGYAKRIEFRSMGKWKELRESMKPVVSFDLRMVDHVDFLIVYFDVESHPCGTFDEVFMAAGEKKPVVVMCPQGVPRIYDWMFARLRPEMFFDTWDGVKQYLLHVAYDDNVDTLGKWKFFDIENVILEIVSKDYTLVKRD